MQLGILFCKDFPVPENMSLWVWVYEHEFTNNYGDSVANFHCSYLNHITVPAISEELMFSANIHLRNLTTNCHIKIWADGIQVKLEKQLFKLAPCSKLYTYS